MTKNRIKTILIAVALVLLVALTAGLLAHFLTKEKPDNGIGDNTPELEIGGKVYADTGEEMASGMVYAMPRAMTISALSDNVVSQTTLTATVTPANATDNTVSWSIKFADGSDTEGYLSLEPTYDGANCAVLTCYQSFFDTAIITVTSNYDAEKKSTCYIDYLRPFNADDLSMTYGNVVFNQENSMSINFSCSTFGSVEGDLEYGDLYIELDDSVIGAVNKRLDLQDDFIPTYKVLSSGYSSDGITFNVPSPYECFAANSGIDETTFNEAFTRAIYFGCGEDCDYHAIFHFTAKYLYGDKVVTTEHIWHESTERLTVDFSLDGLIIPVEDVTINGSDIVIGVDEDCVVCTFDNADSTVIASDERFTVTGKQGTCSATSVEALGMTFTKVLKMETATTITFTTTTDTTLKIYVDTAGKKIKVDDVAYTSESTADGDNVVTVTLTAGSHTITKGDVLSLFGLTLENV